MSKTEEAFENPELVAGVVFLARRGYGNKKIAARLGVSEYAVNLWFHLWRRHRFQPWGQRVAGTADVMEAMLRQEVLSRFYAETRETS